MTEPQARAFLITAMAALIEVHMGWDAEKSTKWMFTENLNLGGATPAQLVMQGRSHKVLAFIEARIEEEKE